jgi:multisubunit Na+/H+ antiporter MnhB subunit
MRFYKKILILLIYQFVGVFISLPISFLQVYSEQFISHFLHNNPKNWHKAAIIDWSYCMIGIILLIIVFIYKNKPSKVKLPVLPQVIIYVILTIIQLIVVFSCFYDGYYYWNYYN